MPITCYHLYQLAENNLPNSRHARNSLYLYFCPFVHLFVPARSAVDIENGLKRNLSKGLISVVLFSVENSADETAEKHEYTNESRFDPRSIAIGGGSRPRCAVRSPSVATVRPNAARPLPRPLRARDFPAVGTDLQTVYVSCGSRRRGEEGRER